MATIYKFYKKSGDKSDDLKLKFKYPLYAITKDKKLAKKFMKSRDMNKFICRKHKISDEDYVKYINKHSILEIDEYEYYGIEDRVTKDWEKVKIVSTWSEKENVEDLVNNSIFYEGDIFNNHYMLLNKKYIKCLETIMYNKFYDIYTGNCVDYEYPDIMVDEVEIFINLYGDLLSEEL